LNRNKNFILISNFFVTFEKKLHYLIDRAI